MTFNLSYLLKKCENKEYDDIYSFLDSEFKFKQSMMFKSKDKYQKEELKMYLNYVEGFLWFLTNGTRPANIDKYDFYLFKPIVTKLVSDGMNPSVL